MVSAFIKLCFFAGVLALAYSAPQPNKVLRRSRRDTDPESVTATTAFINSISSHFHSSQNKDVITILGLPGAGKTTLINFLTKPISTLTAVDSNGKFYITSQDTTPSSQYENFVPIEFTDENSRVFYEIPSFTQKNNASTEITSAYFTKKVFDDANKVKIIFPFSHSKISTEFTKLIESAEKLIPDFDVFKNSISLIITKVNEDSSDDDIISNIVKSLKDIKLTVNDKQNWIKFIDIITSEKDSKYPNIGLFKRPTKAGALNLDSDMQANKQSLLHLVHDNSQFVSTEKSFTRYALNDENKAILDEVLKSL